ncbi:hypothetical protein WME77_11610 [Sorangium sp. So ce764]|uniref:hypothetical protein n=1 Tax=Sorangium sp. So ce764 TaxID=3133320 RepID=UPI003F61EC95
MRRAARATPSGSSPSCAVYRPVQIGANNPCGQPDEARFGGIVIEAIGETT